MKGKKQTLVLIYNKKKVMKLLIPKDKEAFAKRHFIHRYSLDEYKICLHCGEKIKVGDYKVLLEKGELYIVCPNAPRCDGTMIDWVGEAFANGLSKKHKEK